MTILTLHCLVCSGTGRQTVGSISVKCTTCKGVGSVPGVASKPPAPVLTLEDALRQIRQLQQAIVMLAQPDQPPALVVRRLLVREIEAELKKGRGAG